MSDRFEAQAQELGRAWLAPARALFEGEPQPSGPTTPSWLCGLVVALRLPDGALRCAAGTSEVPPTRSALLASIVHACRDDPRALPLAPGEAARLRLELTLLGVARDVRAPDEVDPKRDALVVRKPPFHGLLTPAIAEGRAWSAKTYLTYACRKAGLRGDAYLEPETEVRAHRSVLVADG